MLSCPFSLPASNFTNSPGPRLCAVYGQSRNVYGGLKKLLAGYRVPAPLQGYWNKVLTGKRIPPRLTPPPRNAGQSERIHRNGRFMGVIRTIIRIGGWSLFLCRCDSGFRRVSCCRNEGHRENRCPSRLDPSTSFCVNLTRAGGARISRLIATRTRIITVGI
jgi:hypothetical protein